MLIWTVTKANRKKIKKKKIRMPVMEMNFQPQVYFPKPFRLPGAFFMNDRLMVGFLMNGSQDFCFRLSARHFFDDLYVTSLGFHCNLAKYCCLLQQHVRPYNRVVSSTCFWLHINCCPHQLDSS